MVPGFETCWVPSYTSIGVKRRPPDGFHIRSSVVYADQCWEKEVGGRVLVSDEEMEGTPWERYQALVERFLDAGYEWP